MSKKKKVYVLLTSLPDRASRMVQFLTNYPYSHASLGLEEDLNTYYSFTFKGFTVEDITRKATKPGRRPFDCLLYEIEVSEYIYMEITAHLRSFIENRECYRYSRLGAVLRVLFHIPLRLKNRFFCSQFVADILQRSKAADLPGRSQSYLPQDFPKLRETRLRFQGDLLGYIRHFGLAPAVS